MNQGTLDPVPDPKTGKPHRARELDLALESFTVAGRSGARIPRRRRARKARSRSREFLRDRRTPALGVRAAGAPGGLDLALESFHGTGGHRHSDSAPSESADRSSPKPRPGGECALVSVPGAIAGLPWARRTRARVVDVRGPSASPRLEEGLRGRRLRRFLLRLLLGDLP